jgi:glycosyltransferase involved in cell wall biosynthesis
MPKCRILSTRRLTNRLPADCELDYYPVSAAGAWEHICSLARLVVALRHYDAFLVVNAEFDLMIVSLATLLVSRHRVLIFFYDTNLQPPSTLRAHIACALKSICFLAVDRFLCIHKDISGYQRYYVFPHAKYAYVPYKPSNHSRLPRICPRDDGYIFAGGTSWRDYRTLVLAVKDIGYPTLIVLPPEGFARDHNTQFNEADLPKNIRVIRHDLNSDTWNSYLASARIVVVPIKKEALQPAGISVYLQAMAIGKPVIVTDCPSSRWILSSNEAVIVPPADPPALAEAIAQLWEDRQYRDAVASKGKEYALSLGGEDRLVKQILEFVVEVWTRKRQG